MKFPISRQEESTFPEFTSHHEAAAFFKERFGSDFIFEDSEPIDGMQCHFYCIVTDHESYFRGRKLLNKGQSVSGELGMKYLLSHQPVQIMENGSVHIVY